jgi:type III restriction enzyme
MSIVGTGSSRLRLTEENIEHLFDATGRLLAAGEGLHRTYWKRFHDPKKPNEAKLELFAVMQQQETLAAIIKAAKEEFDKLWMQHKSDIQKLSASIRTRFHALIQASGVPSVQDWELPESIVEKKEGGSWEKHLFCDADGKFSAALNGWETDLLKDEMKKDGFVCWLRNVQRRDWALCIPYGSPVKSFYPDFVIVRKSGKGLVVDILEPHDASRGDTVPKAIGLAKFADEHGEEFGRLIIARKKGDKWQMADMNDKAVREKTKKMQPQTNVDQLFA